MPPDSIKDALKRSAALSVVFQHIQTRAVRKCRMKEKANEILERLPKKPWQRCSFDVAQIVKLNLLKRLVATK